MKTFNLPDLGEGLPDAEIKAWHVNVGDQIKVDQPIISVETAKAIVEVPSPFAGRVVKRFGEVGEVIPTHAPLLTIEDDGKAKDTGTVVGELKTNHETFSEQMIIGSAEKSKTGAIKATPAVRALAKQLNIDLNTVIPSGPQGQITAQDVQKATPQQTAHGNLQGVRRGMAAVMTQSHAQIVPVTVMDDADINHWNKDADITVRLIQALIAACHAEPQLNAWYDTKTQHHQLMEKINIGLAVDTKEGLFVPVLKDVEKWNAKELRTEIDKLKHATLERTLQPHDFQEATISLSNFGTMAGRYASPIIIPPMVAILAVGRLHDAVVAAEGKPVVHRILPLSLTFDHRVVTGGEASRFLAAVIRSLQS